MMQPTLFIWDLSANANSDRATGQDGYGNSCGSLHLTLKRGKLFWHANACSTLSGAVKGNLPRLTHFYESMLVNVSSSLLRVMPLPIESHANGWFLPSLMKPGLRSENIFSMPFKQVIIA